MTLSEDLVIIAMSTESEVAMDKCKIYEANGYWYLSSEELTNCGGFTSSLSAVQSAEAFGYTDIEVLK